MKKLCKSSLFTPAFKLIHSILHFHEYLLLYSNIHIIADAFETTDPFILPLNTEISSLYVHISTLPGWKKTFFFIPCIECWKIQHYSKQKPYKIFRRFSDLSVLWRWRLLPIVTESNTENTGYCMWVVKIYDQ